MRCTDFSQNLCLVEEKLVKEQASVKTDLEMAVYFSTFCSLLCSVGNLTERDVDLIINCMNCELFLKFCPTVLSLFKFLHRFGICQGGASS